jgi:axial budding pattern protein 2
MFNMHSGATTMIGIWGAWLFASGVTASPTIAFPFNSQIPQVARVGEVYNFELSQSTFQSESGSVQYTLTDAPSWLSLLAQSRNLTGTPGAGDIGTAKFTIIGTDDSGSASIQATLIVANPGGPLLGEDISDTLGSIGKQTGLRSVVFPPITPFAFDIPTTVFADDGKPISYYATLGDHTPLPAWINFDAASLHFSGTTPGLDKFPQQLTINLIASDILEFASIETSFTFAVSSHEFYFSSIEQTANVPVGGTVAISNLRNDLVLDGRPINDSDFLFANATVPSWLSFDSHSLSLTGVPPQLMTMQNISIEAHDRYGDVAGIVVHLNLRYGQLYTGNIGILNATAGHDFNYSLGRSNFNQDNLSVQVDMGVASEWLHFDSQNLTIDGHIPASTPAQTVQATLIVTSQDKNVRDVQQFEISIGKSPQCA